jgi:biopolymer transport protein TolR
MTALRQTPLICQIDMTAFTGVMFVLLFVMIFANPYAICRGVGVDLPRIDHPSPMPGADRDDALIVGIMRDGKVFFGNDQVARGELSGKVAQRLAYATERKIYVKADARARYGAVKAALDGIWSAGVQLVGIMTERRQGRAR